eukprot:TRINITY_DN2843_c0_g1_i1.p1 TRINITY_DN2843_c0_g1~~TRINITY_DN2843_c0_g1_i1.p1  ORF type:complete len:278 (-),score=92.95 TRINITY_DN2843_c0_g1_i1:3-806(-)
MEKAVLTEINLEKNVGIITLNRANRANSITREMSNSIVEALHQFEKNLDIRVIILQATGKYFCSGMDLGSSNQSDIQKDLSGGTTNPNALIFETLYNYPKPVICKVNGAVLGGGLGIFFATDFRIVQKDVYFSLLEVKRGILPALISAYIVPQLGLHKSKEFMMTGQKVSAEEFHRLGVITNLVSDDTEMEKETWRLVEELKSSAPNAVTKIKELTKYINSHPHEMNKEHTNRVFGEMMTSEEAAYGIGCFMRKEKPDWTSFERSKL